MALKKEIEEVLKEYAPEHQAHLRKYYEDHPELQDKVAAQFLAQSDYSRNIQDAKKLQKEAEDERTRAEAKYNKNLEWFKDSEEEHTTLQTDNARLKAELEAAVKARAAVPGSGDKTVDQAKIDSEIAELRKNIVEVTKALQTAKEDTEKRLGAGGMFLIEIDDAADRYQREFGQHMNRKEFNKFMNDNNVWDMEKAYTQFTEKPRQEKWMSDKEKELTDKITANLKKDMPFDTGTGAILEKGPLQRFIHNDDKIPDGVHADGSGRLAAIAAAELRAEGKG